MSVVDSQPIRGYLPSYSDHYRICTKGVVSARHSEGPPFSAISSSELTVRDTVRVRVRVRVRVSHLVVAISRTITCNDHE